MPLIGVVNTMYGSLEIHNADVYFNIFLVVLLFRVGKDAKCSSHNDGR